MAQVVAAGFGVSELAGENGTIVKLTRVMMLAPLLIIISILITKKSGSGQKLDLRLIPIPWFVFWFIGVSGFNSLQLLSKELVESILELDRFLLALSMAALGIETNLAKIKNAGMKPIWLATILFGWLLVGGYFVTLAVGQLA